MKILFVFMLSGLAALGQGTAGIGVVLGQDGAYVVVKNLLPDSPAAANRAIQAGDRIIAVAEGNDAAVDVRPLELAQVISLLRGPKDTTVRVTVVPAGEDESQARVVSFVRGQLKELTRWGDGKPLPLGTEAPNISMVLLPGKEEEQLTNHFGKVIVLEFWATWCGPCQQTMAMLQDYPAKYPNWKDQVVLIAASVDEDPDTAVKNLKLKGWDKTHNVWVGIEARKAYHIDSIPAVYVIDRNGRAVASGHVEDLPAVVNRTIREGQLYKVTVDFHSGWGQSTFTMAFVVSIGQPFSVKETDGSGRPYLVQGQLDKADAEKLVMRTIKVVAPNQETSASDWEIGPDGRISTGSTRGQGWGLKAEPITNLTL